jgi:hypothetical protein
MAETGRKRRVPATEPEPSEPPAAEHAAARCPVTFCPICIAVTGTQPLRGEVLGHLLAAGQELLLAMQAVTSAPSKDEGDGDPPVRLEKIDLG